MARYSGRHGVAYVSSSGGSAATSVIGLSKWTLDESVDTVEVSAFGDGNKVWIQGLSDRSGTMSGFWDNTSSDTIFQAVDSTTAVNIYLYPSSDVSAKYWYGTAWMSATVEADVKDAVKISASFKAAGAWGRL